MSDLDEQQSVSSKEGLWRSVKESGDPVGCRGSGVKPRFGMGASGSLISRPQNHVLLYQVGCVYGSSATRVSLKQVSGSPES